MGPKSPWGPFLKSPPVPDLEKLGDEYVHIDQKMAFSEPLGIFFSIGVPSGLL